MRKIIILFLIFHFRCLGFGQEATKQDSLEKTTRMIRQVEVNAQSSDDNIRSGSVGSLIDVKEVKLLPKFLGESDPYKSLQYLGGVSQPGEGSGALYVRGGNADQNQVIFNGSTVHTSNHILGIFSIFNSDVVDQMRFVKSGIPAEYGNKLSSVVDINTSTNIPEKTALNGSIGFILSRLAIKIPIKNRFCMYGAVRGSYLSYTVLPMLRQLKIDTAYTNSRYDFYDINTGFIYKYNNRSIFSGHFYTGNDAIQVGNFKRAVNFNRNVTDWTNLAFSTHFNRIFTATYSMHMQLSYSGFRLMSTLNWLGSFNELQTRKKVLNYRCDFLQLHHGHSIKYGANLDFNYLIPKRSFGDSLLPIDYNKQYKVCRNVLGSIYLRDEWSVGDWQYNLGVRLNGYLSMADQNLQNEQSYKLSPTCFRTTIDPRMYVRYRISDDQSLKASIMRMTQFNSQVPVFSMGVPFDVLISANEKIAPLSSWQYSMGYFKNFSNNKFETSVECYYKSMNHLLEYNNSITSSILSNVEDDNLLRGNGWASGAEFTGHYTSGNWSGWITYNLGWTRRQFDGINAGESYFAQNDRRHDLSLALIYKQKQRWSFSALFVYATGSRLNLPVSWYIINNNVIWEYKKYNSFQLPDYHRLDLSATYQLKPIAGIRSEINFSIYNAYNRANPYQVFFSTITSGKAYDFKIKMAYMLPIIPSFSWIFHI